MCNLCPDEFNDQDTYCLDLEQFSRARRICDCLGRGPRLRVLWSFANSEATSCRIKECVMLLCFFCGADMDDDSDQYLKCDSFWTILISSAVSNLKQLSSCSHLPTRRLGILHPSILTFKLLAGAYLSTVHWNLIILLWSSLLLPLVTSTPFMK